MIEWPYFIEQRPSFSTKPEGKRLEEAWNNAHQQMGRELGRLLSLEDHPQKLVVEDRGNHLFQNPGGSWTWRVVWEVYPFVE
jgi:hypothetical protein